MPRLSSRIAAVALFLVAATFFTTAGQGDGLPKPDEPSFDLAAKNLPTLDQLVEVTPNIDTSAPETKSFRFTAEMYAPPLDMEMTIAWQRDKLVGMRTLLGKDRYPGWFILNHETQVFDPCKGRIYKLPPTHPRFSLRVSENKFTHSFGLLDFSKDSVAEPIVIDFKSLIRESRDRIHVGRDKHYIWVIMFPTEASEEGEGKAGLLAAYQPQAPHKLLQLEIFPVKNYPPALQIYNISYNDDADLAWPEPPADKLLPKEVTIVDLNNDERITFIEFTEIYAAHTGFSRVQAGLDYEEFRSDETLLGVDWEKTQRFATQVGPKITPLWKYPHTPFPSPAAETAGSPPGTNQGQQR